MSNSLKIKGPPTAVKNLLSGDSGERDALHGAGTVETKNKVRQDQNGKTVKPGPIVVRHPTTPVKVGVFPSSTPKTPKPAFRGNYPTSGQRDSRTPVSRLLGGEPSLTPYKASPAQQRFLRTGQPASGE